MVPLKVSAQASEGMGDYAIASTIKILAKAYVQGSDIEALKRKHIRSLLKMSETKFQKRYAAIYDFLHDAPSSLRMRYGFKKQMSKIDAVTAINRLNRGSITQLIDEIPDMTVALYVRNYLSQTYKTESQNLLQQVNDCWKKMVQKA